MQKLFSENFTTVELITLLQSKITVTMVATSELILIYPQIKNDPIQSCIMTLVM